MQLPAHIRYCIDTLEQAGYEAFAVGGCVRDWLLGIEPHDYDLCTAATPETVAALFSHRTLVTAGMKHGTVGVVFPEGVVEITTYRTEGGYTDGRHPDWVKFVPTIEEDLSRRDFTVNAMAWSPKSGLVDPFGGESDLKSHTLRAVGNPDVRFQEDPLRILRGVRFSVRFGLAPESETDSAMLRQAGLMEVLARERVFDELCKLLPLISSSELVRFAPILTQPIPELASAIGFDQRSPHHAYDLFTHVAHVTAAVPADVTLRWAALLHDVGKVPSFTTDENGRGHFYGHAKVGAQIADGILRRLKAPTALREQVVKLIDLHMTRLEPERKLLRRRLSRLGSDTVDQLLLLQEADMGSKGTGREEEMGIFPEIRKILQEIYEENACLNIKDLAINGQDLMTIGYTPGKALGDCLNRLLEQVVDESLPNDRAALLEAAKLS
ncbi:MAG: HD domain-containing protein [Oscillospiraceae bacterium]|nr:HD domain-containing protein [Oscillospiraceae bacterium]